MLADLDATGAREVVVEEADGRRLSVFVVRTPDGGAAAYVNSCPHRGMPLNWQPDVFLTPERDAIQCAVHLARFRLEDGACFLGPCRRQRLERVPVEVRGDFVCRL